MTDTPEQVPPLTSTELRACPACGEPIHPGRFGVLECDSCGQVHASEWIELPPLEQPAVVWHLPDAHYSIGLIDRWIELDMYGALSVSPRPLVLAARCLSGWASVYGAWVFSVTLLCVMLKDTAGNRSIAFVALVFTLLSLCAWMVSVYFSERSYKL